MTKLSRRNVLIRFSCDAALMTWALTLSVTLNLALDGPLKPSMPTAVNGTRKLTPTRQADSTACVSPSGSSLCT